MSVLTEFDFTKICRFAGHFPFVVELECIYVMCLFFGPNLKCFILEQLICPRADLISFYYFSL